MIAEKLNSPHQQERANWQQIMGFQGKSGTLKILTNKTTYYRVRVRIAEFPGGVSLNFEPQGSVEVSPMTRHTEGFDMILIGPGVEWSHHMGLVVNKIFGPYVKVKGLWLDEGLAVQTEITAHVRRDRETGKAAGPAISIFQPDP